MDKVEVSVLRAICAVCVVLVISTEAISQNSVKPLSVKIDQVIADNYPNMRAYALVQAGNGTMVTNLAPSLFSARIDGMDVKAKATIVPRTMIDFPTDYTIVISNNGIMDGEPLDFQKSAILQFVELMKDKDTLSVYTIGEDATPVFEKQKKDAIDTALINAIAVSAVQPRVYDSVINVLRKVEQRKTERKIVIVISDGRDQNSRFTKEQMYTVLADAGIPIYAIGIRVLSAQSLSNLDEMADKTGGTYVYSRSLSAIPGNLKYLFDCINNCYIITYRIKNVKADDLPHHLEITVRDRDAAGAGQKAFIAVKVPVPLWLKIIICVIIFIILIVIIVLLIIHKIQVRKRMGITRRRCPVCHRLMKDTWDNCPFCKYLPSTKGDNDKRRK